MLLVQIVVAAFLVLHGLVHAIMYVLPYSPRARSDLPFDPSHSWLIGERRAFGLAFAIAVTAAFIVASAAYAFGAGWWEEMVIAAAVASLLLLVVYANRQWVYGYAIGVAIIMAALWAETAP